MERLTITIDLDTLELLKKLAKEDKETVSNYLRRLIRAQDTRKFCTICKQLITPDMEVFEWSSGWAHAACYHAQLERMKRSAEGKP